MTTRICTPSRGLDSDGQATVSAGWPSQSAQQGLNGAIRARVLSLNPKGWTRRELKRVTQAAFPRQFERNPKAFYGMTRRLIERGDVEDRAGVLFASEDTRLSVLARKVLFEINPALQ